MLKNHYDVVILGAGLAGLTLARQLLMNSDKDVLLLEKRAEIPPARQKVGEATVQLSGYYLSKVLDLEEHLLREHFMKYNLRFFWTTPGRENNAYEDFSQSYIRNLSNIATYQLDRNKLEGELLRLNRENPRFHFSSGIGNLDSELSDGRNPHKVSFEAEGQRMEVRTAWLVDTTGRAKFLARKLGLAKSNSIRHGSTFFWVDGLLNVEKLTDLSHSERLLHKNRSMLGHLPAWLATNHFMGEGYWFWAIPLHGKTSLGLVYDREKVPEEEVSSPEKVVAWVCREFPLLARDLPNRKIIDQGLYRDFSYDCRQTISVDRWALSGEAGRFTDPLYSPGGDLISLYNTLITDAILTENQELLGVKTRLYELLMWAFYESYVPSYAVSYEVLGDQECFALKYGWELTIYFTFYVFPFINQVFTSSTFLVPFLDLFARLGTLNHRIQAFITGYYRWKKAQPVEAHAPVFFDFTSLEPLRKAEELFYQTGLSPSECIKKLRHYMANVEKLARFIAVHVYSVVLGDEGLLTNKQLLETLQIENLQFDEEIMRQECSCLDETKDPRFAKAGASFNMHFRPAEHNGIGERSEHEIESSTMYAAAGAAAGQVREV
jgi:2-polyprenyl-6-methoxyphenol hydroxylase-like FAD-dependent oxidoreductase